MAYESQTFRKSASTSFDDRWTPDQLCVSMSFADNLRAVMKRGKVSQSELARRLGIRSQAVNQWLQPGGTAPRGARLVEVASALGVELSELLADTAQPPLAGDQVRAQLLAAIDTMNEEQRRALLAVVKVISPKESNHQTDSAGSDPPAKRRPAA